MKNLAKPIAYFYDVLQPVHLRGNQGRVLKGSTLLNWLKPLFQREPSVRCVSTLTEELPVPLKWQSNDSTPIPMQIHLPIFQ